MSPQTYAHLTISGFRCDPEAIESPVGLPSDLVQRIGQRTRDGHLTTKNVWSSKPPVASGEGQPDFYVPAVFDHIVRRQLELKELLRKHDSGINCVAPRRINGGFHMQPQPIARCAEIGIWLDFDLYNDTREDEHQQSVEADGTSQRSLNQA